MEFRDVVRRRRMVRSFTSDPLPEGSLARILDAGRRAPSAGWSQGVELLVLEGQAETERFWACTFESPAVREEFAWPGLFRAQALVVPFGHARTYLERYSEPDKASTGLGVSEEAWPVPYWLTDAAMAAMSMLLAAVDEDLGALFFGIFEGEDVVRAEFGVPDGYQAVGALALGHPAPDRSSGSLRRGRRPAAEIVHRGHW